MQNPSERLIEKKSDKSLLIRQWVEGAKMRLLIERISYVNKEWNTIIER